MPATYTLGRLYDFLFEKLDNFHSEGRLDVLDLALAADTSDKALYKAFKENRLTPGIAAKIIRASENRLTRADLANFVIVID